MILAIYRKRQGSWKYSDDVTPKDNSVKITDDLVWFEDIFLSREKPIFVERRLWQSTHRYQIPEFSKHMLLTKYRQIHGL